MREMNDGFRSAAAVPEARGERSLDPEEVVSRLEDAIAGAARQARDEDPRRLPDAALVAHLVEHHHAYVRRAMPYILPLLAKVVGSHRKRNAKLSALCDAGQELADALEAHLEEEEQELFPALLAGATGRERVRREVELMVRHHREVALVLARIRWLADGYVAPAWGGQSYEALMEELEALEEDLLEHMHLESYVLVPRVSSRYPDPC